MLNERAKAIASAYIDKIIEFEQADQLINELNVICTDWMLRNKREPLEPAWSIYLCFDDAETSATYRQQHMTSDLRRILAGTDERATSKFLSHVILGTNDAARAVKFYDAVLGVLGIHKRWEGDVGAGYGSQGKEGIDTFWINKPLDGNRATVGNGTNVCFIAPHRAAVDDFHMLALELGATDEGAPGLRHEVHDTFYACYLRDLDGHKIVVASHTSE